MCFTPALAVFAEFVLSFFFFFNDTATTEIYTLSLHDALPISLVPGCCRPGATLCAWTSHGDGDRKSTRLNSSHTLISYAVFCLKKNKICALRLRMAGLSRGGRKQAAARATR